MAPDATYLTYLFTDLESSTALWERFEDSMHQALARHDAILVAAVDEHGGRLVKTTGDGLMAVFTSPTPAVEASLQAQRQLDVEEWGQPEPLRVRIGIHSGESTPRAGDYYGSEVNRAARVMSAGHGGQTLVTRIVADAIRDSFSGSARCRDLGTHRLKDLSGPEHLFQLTGLGLPDTFPPLSTLDLRANNLPTQPSSFLGRDRERRLLEELLDDETVRLITLTGPGGSGKTRLALQAAANRIDRFTDGVFFVDLSPVRIPVRAYTAILRSIDLESAAEEDPLDALVAVLREASMLLILDNFEQVTEAADGVARLLAECPSLQVVATSREALHLQGERLFPVPPLPLPDLSGSQTVESIGESEAVQLFVERAAAARQGFQLTHDNARQVASICNRLDGLPLAIELAAARLRLFSPEDLDRRLESRLDLLRGGARDLPTRQRTLRGTIEWSVELLTDDERKLFAAFGRFSGASVEAVEFVVDSMDELDIDALDGLASLVDKSLIRSEETSSSTLRFRMLETIRDYAQELLASEPELSAAAEAAHARAYLEMAVATQPMLNGPLREEGLAALNDDIENLRGSWRFWVARDDTSNLNTLLDTLWALHDARGWYDGIVDLANDLLDVLSREPDTPARTRDEIALQMSVARAMMSVRGYTPEVEERFNRALALTDGAGGLPQRFPVLRSLASLHMLRSENNKAAGLGRELVSLADGQDDAALTSEAYYVLGANLVLLNQFDEGLEYLDKSIELFDPSVVASERFRLGPSPGVVALTTSAFAKWWLCLPDQAVACAERALDIAVELAHPTSRAYAHYHVALLHLWRQDFEGVATQAHELMGVATEHDYPIWRSLAMVLLGLGRIAADDQDRGIADMETGVAIYETLKTPPGFTAGLFLLRSMGYAMAGRSEEAIEFLTDSMEGGFGQMDTPFSAMGNVAMGDLHLSRRPPEPAVAEDCYTNAFDDAHRLGVLALELEAASRLLQLRLGTPQETEARLVVRRAYDRVTEGFEEPIVTTARSLLEGDGSTAE